MSSWASERLSAAKTGWVIVALMVGWVLFLVLPFGRNQEEAPAKTAELRPGEAELAAVGLAYNVDWVGLPAFFPVWAEGFAWEGNKVRFAYWNPVSRSYSYFFEATREGSSFRFRELTASETEPFAELAVRVLEGDESELHPFEEIDFEWMKRMPTIHIPPPFAPYLPVSEHPGKSAVEIRLAPSQLEPPKKLEQEESIYGPKP
jgi:hypothetical protein